MRFTTRGHVGALLVTLLLGAVVIAVDAAVVDNGDGSATIAYTAPAHAALDAAVGLGYFRAACTAELVTAGVCPVADGAPLPTTTATAGMVTQGRVRSVLQGQTIPALASASAFLDYRVRSVLTGYRDAGRAEMQLRATTPVDVSDPLEVQ